MTRTWREPEPGTLAVLLRCAAAGACVLVAVVSGVLLNFDVAAVAALVGVALVVDLWRDLRPRQLVVVGPDLVVVHRPRRTTTVPRRDVVGVGTRPRRLRRAQPVLELSDGSTVPLPSHVPVAEVTGWLAAEAT